MKCYIGYCSYQCCYVYCSYSSPRFSLAFNESFFILLGLLFTSNEVDFSSSCFTALFGTILSCERFRRTTAFGVLIKYDLGVLSFSITFPRHFISVMNTVVPTSVVSSHELCVDCRSFFSGFF